MFNIGSTVVKLSQPIKDKLRLHRGRIYLGPQSEFTEELLHEAKKLGFKNIRFIDLGHSTLDSITGHDLVIIDQPNKNRGLVNHLSRTKIYFIFHRRKFGIDVLPLSQFNLLYIQWKYLATQLYLNILHRARMHAADKLHIPLHKNERRLITLRRKHQSKRAFIIGNGPSLKVSDLDKLKNEITFACNKIYLAFNETGWRPTYYTVEDNLVIHEIYDEIVKFKNTTLKDTTIIMPFKDLREYDAIEGVVYYPLIGNKDRTRRFSDNMLKGIYPGHTVTYSMIETALFMGISEIYLIGIDFSFYIADSEKNKTVIYNTNENNHFHKGYRQAGDKWIRPTPELQIKAYESALRFCNTNDIKIFNASRTTKLNVFEKVNFDDLF